MTDINIPKQELKEMETCIGKIKNIVTIKHFRTTSKIKLIRIYLKELDENTKPNNQTKQEN